MPMNSFSTTLLIFFITWNVFQDQNYTRLDLTDFNRSIMADDIQLIDVRTPEEFEAGHIPKATNINVLNPEDFQSQVECLDPEKPVYLYCKLGGRSKRAAKELEQIGFTQLYDLRGGYLLWKSFQ